MKCPHCDYFHGFDFEKFETTIGDKGGYFSLPIKMERKIDWAVQQMPLYACPSCGKVFTNVISK